MLPQLRAAGRRDPPSPASECGPARQSLPLNEGRQPAAVDLVVSLGLNGVPPAPRSYPSPRPGPHRDKAAFLPQLILTSSPQAAPEGQAARLVWGAPSPGARATLAHPRGARARPRPSPSVSTAETSSWALRGSQGHVLVPVRPWATSALFRGALRLPRPPRLKEFARTGRDPAQESVWDSLGPLSKPHLRPHVSPPTLRWKS